MTLLLSAQVLASKLFVALKHTNVRGFDFYFFEQQRQIDLPSGAPTTEALKGWISWKLFSAMPCSMVRTGGCTLVYFTNTFLAAMSARDWLSA
jgi:hypothetical protein